MPYPMLCTTSSSSIELTTLTMLQEYFTITKQTNNFTISRSNISFALSTSAVSDYITFTAKKDCCFSFELTFFSSSSDGNVQLFINEQEYARYRSQYHATGANTISYSLPIKKNDTIQIKTTNNYSPTFYLDAVINGPIPCGGELYIMHNNTIKTVKQVYMKNPNSKKAINIYPSWASIVLHQTINGTVPTFSATPYTYILCEKDDEWYIVANIDFRSGDIENTLPNNKNYTTRPIIVSGGGTPAISYDVECSLWPTCPTHYLRHMTTSCVYTITGYEVNVQIASNETNIRNFSVEIYDDSGAYVEEYSKFSVTSYDETIPIGYTYKIVPSLYDGYGSHRITGTIKNAPVQHKLSSSDGKILTVKGPSSIGGISVSTSGYTLFLTYTINSIDYEYSAKIQRASSGYQFLLNIPTNSFVELKQLRLTNAPKPVGQTATTKTINISHNTFDIQMTANKTATISSNGSVTIT